MRVQLQTEGGIAFFPGLSKPVVVDSAELPKEQGARFEQLVDSARLFDLPARSRTPSKAAADYRQYTITIQDGKRRRTVRLTDPIDDPNIQALIDFLQEQRAQSGPSAPTPDSSDPDRT
jgi:hypothetical protein